MTEDSLDGRLDLIKAYRKTRALTLSHTEPLTIEDYVPQSAVFASPPKWHLAHTTWFFEEMILKKYQKDYVEYDEIFNFLFNSYYQSLGKRSLRNHRGLMTRPSVEKVLAFRQYVDQAMEELLSDDPDEEVRTLVVLGINHEQQHQELLLTDLKYTLSFNPLNPVYHPEKSMVDTHNKNLKWATIDEGLYEIGHDGDGFSFDNELCRHKVYLNRFKIADFLVTNGDYIEFMEDGGYMDFSHWHDEGWTWVNENKVSHPLYWEKVGGEWHYFTLGGFKKVDKEAILCHVSFYEAYAFAQWKGMRLPTEFEWEVASNQLNWGDRWEWTYSAYLPYPGFKIAEGAVGEYNGKFMVNTMVLRGSSGATSEGHSRRTYRNFFHPQYQWQFTGIRLVE